MSARGVIPASLVAPERAYPFGGGLASLASRLRSVRRLRLWLRARPTLTEGGWYGCVLCGQGASSCRCGS